MERIIRAPWQVMYASLFAIVVRDIQKKFIKTANTQRSIAFLRIVLEPMLHVFIWVMLHAVLRRSGTLSATSLSPVVFVLLGALPFLFFRDVFSSSISSIKSNKSFYVFRQIKPCDPIIAHVISSALISVLVMFVLLAGLKWFGVDWHVYDLMRWVASFLCFGVFLLGCSFTVAVACFFINPFSMVMTVIMRIMYLFSGIFFSAASLPPTMREIMLFNPVFQFIELSRNCFMAPSSYIAYASLETLSLISLATLMFGLALYLTLREKIMRDIQQR